MFALLAISFGSIGYKSWKKSERIAELETTISLNKMYGTPDQLKSSYKQELIESHRKFNTMNDSLNIAFTLDKYSAEASGTNLIFGVTCINKLKKQIKYVNGVLTLKTSADQIIIDFPLELTSALFQSDTSYWQQSWNLDRYTPLIKEQITKSDLKTIVPTWTTKIILFQDNSGLVLNEKHLE